MTPSFRQVAARLCGFLREIYGELPNATKVEIDIEGQSGGAYGKPHLEVTAVRIYGGTSQLLPDLDAPYWEAMLRVVPDLFQGCETHQDRLDAVQDLLEGERIYQEYSLDWLDENEKILSLLCLSIQELHALANNAVRERESKDQK